MTKKHFFILCFLIIFFTNISKSSFCQTVVVTVLDQTEKKPLPNAHVTFCNLKGKNGGTVLADAQGNATLPLTCDALKEKFLLRISYLGFITIADTLKSCKSLIFYMKPEKINIQEVVITAQYAPNSPEKAIHKVNIINRKKIESMAATNLKDVMSNELNIRISQDNVLGSGMSMQGISGENVKIMIDGVPVIGRLNGNIDLSQIQLTDVERIEVIEGPLSVNYGTNALAGSINIITKKSFVEKQSFTFNSYTENIGTYNLNANFSQKIKDNRISITLGRNFFDGWSKTDEFFPDLKKRVADASRFKEWKPREQYFGRLQYNYQYKKLLFGYKGEYFNEKITNFGLPRKPYFESAFDDYYYTNRFDNSIYVNGAVSKQGNINFLASYNQYKRIKNSFLKDLTTLEEILIQTPGEQDTSMFSNFETRGSYSTSKDSAICNHELGFDINLETASGARLTNGKDRMQEYAVFATSEVKVLNKIFLRPGIRYAYNSSYKAPLIPSLNVKYNLGNIALRASYAKGFRAPSLKELYFYFVDVNHNIKGNDLLKAETSYNFTLNLTYKMLIQQSVFQAEAGSFYNSISNMITLAQISNLLYSYQNIGTYKTQGVSMNLSYVYQHLKINLGSSYTGRYNQFTDSTASNEMSWSPELRGNITYEWPLKGISVSAFYKYQGELPGFGINSDNKIIKTTIGSYSIADITIAKSFMKNKLKFATGIKNIFNVIEVYNTSIGGAHSGGSSSSSPVGTGRMLFINIDYKFSKK